jgi:hypothetical protein
MKECDVIIIGGGISGLYTAYKLKQMSPEKTFIILERNGVLGGRMNKYKFCNVDVNIGAGIGRKAKDGILTRLIDDLGIGYKEFPVKVSYSKAIECKLNIDSTLNELRRKYQYKIHARTTFKNYASNILGTRDYECFVTRIGFSDFEMESTEDVIKYYGMEDNRGGWTGMNIDWRKLIESISNTVSSTRANIILNEEVLNISKTNINHNNFIVCGNHHSYLCKKIVIASTIDTVRRLLPQYAIFKGIHGQPFIRIYGKFDIPIPGMTGGSVIVPGPLQKITPINIDCGIYMIAYSDNASADLLRTYSQNNVENRLLFSNLILESLGLDKNIDLKLTSIKSFYWNIGTHYYSPLNRKYATREDFLHEAQNPQDNIFVVGEMISLHQGWSSGAMESVESVIQKIAK